MEKNLDYTCFDNYTAADLAVDDSFIEWVNSDGTASKFWDQWIEMNPHKSDEIQSARFLVLALVQKEKHASANEINEAWSKVADTIGDKKLIQKKSPKIRFLYYLTAAVILIGLISSTSYFLQSKRTAAEAELVVKYTNNGQQLTTLLPDGSKVVLNAGSQISYSKAFGESQRQVNLSGEAYFDIRHNPDVPFVVNVGDIETRVLGTTFNVKSYSSDQVEIALETGSIQVVDQTKDVEILLEPGQFIRIDSLNIHEIQKYNHRDIFGWKNAYLCFTKSSFTEAIKNLERWYGVDFVIQGNVRLDDSWKFHGKFHDKSLAYVLHTLSYPNLFKYEIKDKQVTIY